MSDAPGGLDRELAVKLLRFAATSDDVPSKTRGRAFLDLSDFVATGRITYSGIYTCRDAIVALNRQLWREHDCLERDSSSEVESA